jgi:hypothetical protein
MAELSSEQSSRSINAVERCLNRRLVGAIAALQASVERCPHFKSLELLGEAWLLKGTGQSHRAACCGDDSQ